MKARLELIEAQLYKEYKRNSFIDYCRYVYNGEKVLTAFLYRSSFPYKSRLWGTLCSTLINMEKHGFASFPFTVNTKDIIVGRVEEYL